MQISTKKCDVSSDTRERAVALVEKLQKFDSDLLSADLIFQEEGVDKEVEAILSIARAEPVVATGSGGDFNAAADDLFSKLSKILRRRRGQIRSRARSGSGD